MRNDWLSKAAKRAEERLLNMSPEELGPAGRILMGYPQDNVVYIDSYKRRKSSATRSRPRRGRT